MKPVDELVPLTAEELQMLESKRFSSTIGCGTFALAVFFIIVYFVVSAFPQKQFITSDYVVYFVLAVIAILLLIFAFFQFKQRQTENPDIALDIKEGKKRRIVAPVEGKDMVFVSRNGYVNAQSQSTTPRANDATLIDLSSYENKIDIDDRSVFEGKNLRKLTPLAERDFLDFKKYEGYLYQNNAWMSTQKNNPGSHVHIIKIGEFIFTISSEEYLTGFRKGDFVEFSFCPNSKKCISLPEEVRE